MRIYLDTCVFQDLKKESLAGLYQMITNDTAKNLYCFSEAHIQDLIRDRTNEKLADMAFMETIVGINCWSHDKDAKFSYNTPREYYEAFDWSGAKHLFSDDDGFGSLLKTMMQTMPLNFDELIKPDQLPADFPEEFKTLLLQPTNMYEFMEAMVDMTEALNDEQKRFKKMIQYLHKNMLLVGLYTGMGIDGFDGIKVTDLELFRPSYSRYIMKDKKEMKRYDLFMQMHSGLELTGIVKGSPKKQKFMNLINDSRHAFFGAYCDIVVTKDADMINKTRFMYTLWNIKTKVLTIEEFQEFLNNELQRNEKASDIFNEVALFEQLPTLHTESTNEKTFIVKKLTKTYLSIFDTLNFVQEFDGKPV